MKPTTLKRGLLIAALATTMLTASCSSSQKLSKSSLNTQTIDAQTKAKLENWKNDHFGMFIHFGIYSKLEGYWKGEKIPFYGEQIMNHARIPIPEYEAVAREFNPVDFDPDQIVELAQNAGMKYIVITTKHHDGFCMFDTKTTNYDIVDFTPYGKDIVGQLAEACHRKGMKLGFYYSLPDWHYPFGIPRLLPDTSTKCWQHVNQVYSPLEQVTPQLEDYIVSQITELLTNYGEICTIWFDMGLITPQQSQRFRRTVKSLQPNCLINGRIMNNLGDYMTLPDNGDVASYGDIYWDNPASLYGTWGYKSWINRPPLQQQINLQLSRLKSTVRNGGVFLLNIGPDGNGRVIDYEKQVLNGIGDSLRAHPQMLEILSEASHTPLQTPLIITQGGDISLSPELGLFHAALDGTGYMSVEAESWIDWQVRTSQQDIYDVFIIYKPLNNDKEYTLKCGNQVLTSVLPGVDRMVQTAYLGQLQLAEGINTITLDQAKRAYPLEPLGLEEWHILLRPRHTHK